MDVYRKELPDILRQLPEIKPFDASQAWDLIVCVIGFEERSHAIIDKIAAARSQQNTTLLLVRYPTNQDDNNANEIFFEAAGKQIGHTKQISYSRKEYSRLVGQTLSDLTSVGSKVLFDISSCSSYVFYPTISALLNLDIELTIGYAEAETYYPTENEWLHVAAEAQTENSLFVQSFENAEFQSLGVDDIYPSPVFADMNPGNRPGVLIAIPNFSAMRMNAIRTRDRETNNTSFDGVYWIVGIPPGSKNKWRVDAVKATNSLGASERIMEVSTFDYRDMLKTLENIWYDTRYKNYLSVGPLGSKMQHLGTFIFLYLHKDVGLWLAEPKRFRATRFSDGCGATWQVAFRNTLPLRDALDGYMTFSWKF
jgi:hypothetical protein